jgi:hypothetical protein
LECLHNHGDGPCTCTSPHTAGVEDKWITGRGAEGYEHGLGRGELLYGQKNKLDFVAYLNKNRH